MRPSLKPESNSEMEIGDAVILPDGSQGTITQLPRSVGRKRPRVLVNTLSGEQWVHLDELKEVHRASER